MQLDPIHIASLPLEQKRALLGNLLRARLEETRLAPLSISQERLWLTEQLQPGSPLYNIPVLTRIPRQLRVELLQRSFEEVARRHEILRTTFSLHDGQPVQVISPEPHIKLHLVDLSHLEPQARRQEVERLTQEEAQTGFDLSQGPLLRGRVLRLDESDYLLAFTMHHIISDGWSLGILFQELWANYEALCQGRTAQLRPLPLQYADFARRQREWLRGPAMERLRTWWRHQLAGAPAVLEVPTDRPRPPAQSFAGAMISFTVNPSLTARTTELVRREGVTLFMLLLSVWKTLLFRYTGQGDLLVGTPIAGRNQTELEGLIGFFVNNVALRTQLGDNPSFRELLRRVRDTTLEAYEHQELPFDRLVDELGLERDPSRPALCQVVFNLQNTPTWARAAASQHSQEPESQAHSGTAKFELNLTMMEAGSTGLVGAIEYKTALFDEPTILRLKDHYLTLLESAVARPDCRLLQLDLGDRSETAGATTPPDDMSEMFQF
jgi:hypothetical protein